MIFNYLYFDHFDVPCNLRVYTIYRYVQPNVHWWLVDKPVWWQTYLATAGNLFSFWKSKIPRPRLVYKFWLQVAIITAWSWLFTYVHYKHGDQQSW